MINSLIKLADRLDSLGCTSEADLIDKVITAARLDAEGVEIMEPEEHEPEAMPPVPGIKNPELVRDAFGKIRLLDSELKMLCSLINDNIDDPMLRKDFEQHFIAANTSLKKILQGSKLSKVWQISTSITKTI